LVAQASYHVPGDEGSDDIRAAQASLARDGIALAGPDSDALEGRPARAERSGRSLLGKRASASTAAKWAEVILPWLERQWTEQEKRRGRHGVVRFREAPRESRDRLGRGERAARDTKSWNGVLDEAKWGTPSPDQVVSRNWDWKISDEAWAAAVKEKGEGSREEVRFDLWLPEGLAVVKGMVVMSGHGSGESFFYRADLRALATELGLGCSSSPAIRCSADSGRGACSSIVSGLRREEWSSRDRARAALSLRPLERHRILRRLSLV
jgi:hypothetical protein